jgi:aminomethyltransferase
MPFVRSAAVITAATFFCASTSFAACQTSRKPNNWPNPLGESGIAGAEGATAPETLRQKDQRNIYTLENGGRPLAEGITISGIKDRGGSERTGRNSPIDELARAPMPGGLLLSEDTTDLKKTSLHALHIELGAKMVPFAGYDMPVQYPAGVLKEHLHTRQAAGLFDVSHMGQVRLIPKSGNVGDAALALETLVPVDVLGLAGGRQRYGLFTNETGGILDDLMFANMGDHLFLVVNAACKESDIAHLRNHLSDTCDIVVEEDRALLALQGPFAEKVIAEFSPEAATMRFMDVRVIDMHDVKCIISRSGYTGEDGYEISVPADKADWLARMLLEHPDVQPIGLGARDSLRLEAGLCLYGNDIDTTTTPAEAALGWAIQKARRSGGVRAGGFPGAEITLAGLETGTTRRRVGLKPEGKAPVRGHTALFADAAGQTKIGDVTSGGFGPSVEGPVAMGYVQTAYAANETKLYAEVRGKYLPVTVTTLPFVTPGYKR